MERSHLLTGAALLLILILATAMTLALRGAPAIDRTARLPGAAGDWRVADGPSMYLRPDYLYRLGLGYLEAAGVGSAAPQSETPPADLMRERAETARELLSESLRLAPADARTWTALASANARLDSTRTPAPRFSAPGTSRRTRSSSPWSGWPWQRSSRRPRTERPSASGGRAP
jgi:hypothetical protein